MCSWTLFSPDEDFNVKSNHTMDNKDILILSESALDFFEEVEMFQIQEALLLNNSKLN